MQRLSLSLLCGCLLSAAASAQVEMFTGPSLNLPSPILDFDNPFVPSGTIAPTNSAFTSVGIERCRRIGGSFLTNDVLTPASNVTGQALVFSNGAMSIAGPGEGLDRLDFGAGWEIKLANPVDEFQFKFVDQNWFDFEIELFMAGTSIGKERFGYFDNFPAPPLFFRGPGKFDKIHITLPVGSGGLGIDDFSFGDGPPPVVPPNCIYTTFGGDDYGLDGGTVFFDLALTRTATFSGLATNARADIGTPVGLSVYRAKITHVGKELDPSTWALIAQDDGTTVSAGGGNETEFQFAAPFTLEPGNYGIAIVAHDPTGGNPFIHKFTDNEGVSRSHASADGVMTITGGSATTWAFSGSVSPARIWNGRLCHGDTAGLGARYCAANTNSTGLAASIHASGAAEAALNGLTLEADDLPPQSFAFFLNSMVPGFTAYPAGSAGNLCLGEAIGRYVGPGQVQSSGSTGEVSLRVDLGQTPTPTGFVQIEQGETWYFQCWFRDSRAGAPTSNFTDGLQITFL